MSRLLLSIYDFFRGKRGVAVILLVLVTALLVLGALCIDFNEDISQFLPQNKQTEKINATIKALDNRQQLVFRVFAKDTAAASVEDIENAVDELALNLDSIVGDDIDYIVPKADLELMLSSVSFITRNIPYLMMDEDYENLAGKLEPDSIAAAIKLDKELMLSGGGEYMADQLTEDPLHISLPAIKALSQFRTGGWKLIDDYFFSADGKCAVVVLVLKSESSETRSNAVVLSNVRKAVDKTVAETGTVDIRFFSPADVALTNASQIKGDSLLALTVSLVLIVVLLLLFYRGVKPILYILPPVAFGGIFALAMMWLIKGSVSTIAVGAGSIILGVAIDYSLHFITHHKFNGSARETIKELAIPLTVGSFTTIAAFLSLMFISAEAMRDFGLFAALSLIGTLLFVLIFLPHIVRDGVPDAKIPLLFRKISGTRFERSGVLVALTVLATVVLGFFSGDVKFDTDLSHINYMTDGQRGELAELNRLNGDSLPVCYMAVEAASLDEALVLQDSVLKVADADANVAGMSGVRRYLPSKSEQRRRIALWNEFWSGRRESVKECVERCRKAEGLSEGAFDPFYAMLDAGYDTLAFHDFDILVETFLYPYIFKTDEGYTLVTRMQYYGDMPGYASADGSVFTFNQKSVLVQAIDILKGDFDYVLWVCGIVVFLFLIISFRRLESAVISFLPMTVSWLWILGIMAVAGIEFNVVSVVLATFIFGLGDDYAIFMMDGLQHEYTYGTKMLQIDKNAVILSALTLFIGVFTLILSKHPAMSSLAKITAVGMLSVVFVTFVLPPWCFRCITMRKGKPRNVPFTFKRLLFSLYALGWYIITATLAVVFWLPYMLIGPRTEAKKLKFHKMLCAYSKFVIYRVPGAPYTINNSVGETFEKPALITSNHQSLLDLMAIIALNPKIIFVTNDRVWHNPMYGIIIRLAEYYPISVGYEKSLGRMRNLVDRGYSIVVFPEGTRSVDGKIAKFHPGAFRFAADLGIDILPLFLHGFSHVIPKNDTLFREGRLYLEVQKRIPVSYDAADPTYKMVTKRMRAYYLSEYKRICAERESVEYWIPFVRYKYMYKCRDVELRSRRLLADVDGLKTFCSAEYTGEIYDDAMGVKAWLYALTHPDIDVVARCDTEENYSVAVNTSHIPENLKFKL